VVGTARTVTNPAGTAAVGTTIRAGPAVTIPVVPGTPVIRVVPGTPVIPVALGAPVGPVIPGDLGAPVGPVIPGDPGGQLGRAALAVWAGLAVRRSPGARRSREAR
jgi:hypothetical protein